MEYRIDVFDHAGRRIARYAEVPLLEVVRRRPDEADTVRGLLPKSVPALGPGFRVEVYVDGAAFCRAWVTETRPEWSDTRKLILDQYVPFHEVVEFRAERAARLGNRHVSRAYTNREIAAIVKDVINSAPGDIHYWVDHAAYPDGAEREYAKFLGRKTEENELEVGGIAAGQWVDSVRMDLSGAYAKDGDTIAGIVVDGAAWPDLRMMLIDCEEKSRNGHAIGRHPEVADWSDAQYDASGYKLRADAATAALQNLIDTKGIDFIELNPHRDVTGAFDDRVDAYGRYLGLVYGGGECFNAALVEQDHAEVYLYDEGRFHVPEMALKDFFSYAGAHTDSIDATGVSLGAFDVSGGVLEVLTALAYAAGGYTFDVDLGQGVHFHEAAAVNRAVYFDPLRVGVQLGENAAGLGNFLLLSGNPFSGTVSKSYARGESIETFGVETRSLEYFSITQTPDADRLAAGLLDDLAYPEPSGSVTWYRGDAAVRLGEILEVRGAPLRRLASELAEEWGGRFTGKIVGRVRALRHRFSGTHVETTAFLGSPLRSVAEPLGFVVRSQEGASTLFEFRLDDPTVGVDMGFHLD